MFLTVSHTPALPQLPIDEFLNLAEKKEKARLASLPTACANPVLACLSCLITDKTTVKLVTFH